MNTPIYNTEGKKIGDFKLPEEVFNVAWSDSLMHQVVVAMQANMRTPVAHAKSRGEVRGGGKKPWQQKGTGRARHGSIRSPIWRGGGVTHGPRNEKVYVRSIPRNMRTKALFMALSRKLKDNEIILVDSFGLRSPKTKDARKVLEALSKKAGFEKLLAKSKNAALVTFPERSDASYKSFRNIGNIACATVQDLNPVQILGNTYLILENPEAAVKTIAARAKKKQVKTL